MVLITGGKESHPPLWSKKKKTNPNQTWASVPAPLFISPVSVTFPDHQTQEPRWLVNEISVTKRLFLCFPSPRFFSSLCLFPLVLVCKCCEADAESSVSKRCNVMGWACSVFERCLYARSAPGPDGENLGSSLGPVVIFALPYFAISHNSQTQVF